MTAGVASSNEEAVPRSAPHRAQTLSRTTSRDVSESQARRDALFHAASVLWRVSEPRGLQANLADQDLIALIQALAAEHDASTPRDPLDTTDVEVAMRRFLTALDGAIPAVRTCRQTAHLVNNCWFLTRSTNCGDVLKSAHHHAT